MLLLLTIALPLWALLSKSFQNADGAFVGLANYIRYFSTPTLVGSIFNSVWVAALTTAIVIPLAFVYAYALTRSRMRAKGLFYGRALLPLFAPSLLSAISLIYLFGNQGLLKGWLFGRLDLRPDRHRHGAGVLLLPACADHPGDGACARRRAALRGRRRAGHDALAHLLDRDAAGREDSA